MADTSVQRRATSAEIGAALGLKAATIQAYAREGRIPFGVTPGGHRRFDLDEVRAALGMAPVAKVGTLPCPKCASPDTSMAYCDGCALRPVESIMFKYADDYCRDGDPEHFHRSCRQCGYRWKTDDAIDPRVMCADAHRRRA